MPPDTPQLPSPAWLAAIEPPRPNLNTAEPQPEPEIIPPGAKPSAGAGAKRAGSRRQGVDERMRAFVDNLFALAFNATQAAIAAGYSKPGASVTAARLLQNPSVQAAIAERHRALADKSSELLKRVRAKLEAIAFGDMRSLYHDDGRLKLPTEMSEEEAAMVAGLTYAHKLGMAEDASGQQVVVMVETVKVKFHDPQKALDMLGRHTGLFSADGSSAGSVRVGAKLVVNFIKAESKGD